MEIEPKHNNLIGSLQPLCNDIKTTIIHHAKPEQWWYLDKVFDHHGTFATSYQNPVLSTCFPSSGEHLVTATQLGKVQTLNIKSQKETYSWMHDTWIETSCFDSSGKFFATTSDDHDDQIHIFAINDMNRYIELKPLAHPAWANAICLNHTETGAFLGTTSLDGIARIFDIEKQTEIFSIQHDHRWGTSICFNSTGKLFATASADGEIRVFDREKQTEIYSFSNNSKWITHTICFDPTEKFIAAALHTGEVCLFDLETKTKFFSFYHNNETVKSICFHPTGQHLATGSDNGKARIFTKYNEYTLEQLILKNALLNWLLIEKPDKEINTLEKLLKDVSLKCDLPYKELIKIWTTFHENVRDAILRTMLYRIQKHGKNNGYGCTIL